MTIEVDRVVVPADLDGMRADRAVATLLGIPRTRAHELIDAGLVTVDGVPASPSQRVKAGVEVEVTHRGAPGPVAAVDIPYTVAYEDEHLLVVDKPAGVVVHPASGAGREMLRPATLVSGLVYRYPDLAGLEEQRFGLVHRLDKDTSGLLLVARSAEVHTA
ncbi:MAG: RluA family pseudouridine synthase, partial [Acidimicrobiia bacterium]